MSDVKNVTTTKEATKIEVENSQHNAVNIKENHWIKEESCYSEDDSESEEENQDDFDAFPMEIPVRINNYNLLCIFILLF